MRDVATCVHYDLGRKEYNMGEKKNSERVFFFCKEILQRELSIKWHCSIRRD